MAPRVVRYRGASMMPLFQPLDRLTVEAVALGEIQPGDIVVLRWPDQGDLVVHRVVGRSASGLVTQGDAMARPDPRPLTADCLVGRVAMREREGAQDIVTGGDAGLAWFRRQQRRQGLRRAAGSAWRGALAPISPALARGPLARALARRLTPLVIQRDGGQERRLCLGRRAVAVSGAGEERWSVRALFAPLLDAERVWREKTVP